MESLFGLRLATLLVILVGLESVLESLEIGGRQNILIHVMYK